jgi:flagellin-like protein
MKRLIRSRKALSPVVAAIILIAVTVAVSIAVAAWMGALTFTFMQTEQMSITYMDYPSANNIALTVKNTGTGKVTIASVTVNGVAIDAANWSTDQTLPDNEWAAGEIGHVYITYPWTSGNPYRVVLQSSTGTNVASYEKTA